jgi:hypothetical protein
MVIVLTFFNRIFTGQLLGIYLIINFSGLPSKFVICERNFFTLYFVAGMQVGQWA